MNRAGLSSTELPFSNSSLFKSQNTQTDIDLPLSLSLSLDPNSPAYIMQIYEALGLNGDNYAHLDPEILAELKDLIAKYRHVFWLPGAPLSPINGFDHCIPTGDAPPAYGLLYCKSPAELKQLKTNYSECWP